MSNIDQLSPEDRAFVDCLRKVAESYDVDDTRTDDERYSLSLLIKTFPPSDDSEFDKTLSEVVAQGCALHDIRQALAADAGIIDYAQLYVFATLDVRLASGELQMVDVTGLSDEELLALFSDG